MIIKSVLKFNVIIGIKAVLLFTYNFKLQILEIVARHSKSNFTVNASLKISQWRLSSYLMFLADEHQFIVKQLACASVRE